MTYPQRLLLLSTGTFGTRGLIFWWQLPGNCPSWPAWSLLNFSSPNTKESGRNLPGRPSGGGRPPLREADPIIRLLSLENYCTYSVYRIDIVRLRPESLWGYYSFIYNGGHMFILIYTMTRQSAQWANLMIAGKVARVYISATWRVCPDIGLLCQHT